MGRLTRECRALARGAFPFDRRAAWPAYLRAMTRPIQSVPDPVILQDSLPLEMRGPSRLPGVAPCAPDDWLRVDEAYGPQMALRRRLLAEQRGAVLWCDPQAEAATREVLCDALKLLPGLGFEVAQDCVICPDGHEVALERSAPLLTLGQLVQEDICLLQRRGAEHVLTGGVLCFPAGWNLAEKAGQPLGQIHAPVAEYDARLEGFVQRMFDRVQPGRPICRFNRLTYDNPALFQPQKSDRKGAQRFIRSERQCVRRLPHSDAVLFSIHTFLLRAAQTFEKV